MEAPAPSLRSRSAATVSSFLRRAITKWLSFGILARDAKYGWPATRLILILSNRSPSHPMAGPSRPAPTSRLSFTKLRQQKRSALSIVELPGFMQLHLAEADAGLP